MITEERCECRELHPSIAQLFVRIPLETTCVRAHHPNLKDLELKDALDAPVHVAPLAVVISQPVPSPLARTGERRTADHKRALPWMDGLQRKMSRLLLHETPQVVRVELNIAASVRNIRR